MDEKTLEKSDNSIGQEFEVKKNTANANRIGFSNTLFSVGEKVYIISESERFDLMKQQDQIDEYKARIKELENILADAPTDIDVDDLQDQLKKKDETIATLKDRVDSLGKELEERKDVKVESVEDIESLNLGKNEFITLIELDIDEYRKKYDNKAIKKTLTIPNWLNTKAEANNLNFSKILQNALKKELHIDI